MTSRLARNGGSFVLASGMKAICLTPKTKANYNVVSWHCPSVQSERTTNRGRPGPPIAVPRGGTSGCEDDQRHRESSAIRDVAATPAGLQHVNISDQRGTSNQDACLPGRLRPFDRRARERRTRPHAPDLDGSTATGGRPSGRSRRMRH